MKAIKIIITIIIMKCLATSIFAGGFIIVAPEGTTTWVASGFNPYTLEVRSLKVTVSINDLLAKTTIEQVFYNPTNRNLQGWFLFPVPKGAVIKDFSMDINGKMMQAELLDAAQARKIYEDIVRKSLDPALLEYAEMSLFKVRIFPIEGMKEKKIKISYTEILDKDNNTVEYIFPMNTKKYSAKPLNDISIYVEAKSSEKIKTIYCPSHEVETIRKNDFNATVGYEAKTVKPDVDFKLYLGFDNNKFGMTFLTNNAPAETQGYFMLDISPGFGQDEKEIVNKDITFVIDVSGSMSDKKMEQAKKSLLFCVNNLNKGDKFEIVRFSTVAKALFGKRSDVNKENLEMARTFINDFKAIGGTNIDEALQVACAEKPSNNRPHLIVFITDGKPTIGETQEDKLLEKIKNSNSDNIRIFTFGIGDDINTHLLDKLTEQTKAFRSYIAPDEDIEIKISNFYTKVSSPVLTDVKITFSNGLNVDEIYPRQIPDIFKGTSVIVLGKYKQFGNATITLEGKVNDKTEKISYKVNIKQNTENDFIPQLWATRKIGFLLDQIRLHGSDKELVDEVTQLAKKYGIITPYTSYLILEDEAISLNNNAINQTDAIFIRRFADGNTIRSKQKEEYDNMSKKSGRSSVVSSSEVQNLGQADNMQQIKQGSSRMVYTDKHGKNKNFSEEVKNIQGRAVYQIDEQWIDTKVQNKKNTKVNRIQFASKEYFNLMNTKPETSQFLALGRNVKFDYQNETFEIFE